MKNLTKRAAIFILAYLLVASSLAISANAVRDNQGVKVLLDQKFQRQVRSQTNEYGVEELRVSGWDIREAAGAVWKGMNIRDNNAFLPIELSRRFEQVNEDKLTIEFNFKILSDMNGVSFKLMQEEIVALNIIVSDKKLLLEQSNGSPVVLSDCLEKTDYGVKAVMDLDNKNVCLYINGVLAAQDVPFTNPVGSVNRFNLKTRNETMGEMNFYYITIYTGYLVNEKFATSLNNIPADWDKPVNADAVSMAKMYHDESENIYSLKLAGKSGEAAISKSFQKQSQRLIYEYKMYMPEKSDGAGVYVSNGDENVFGIVTNADNFCYTDAQMNKVPFYEYTRNVWSSFRITLNLPEATADISFNGKSLVSGIKLNANQIDNLKFCVSNEFKGDAWFDDIAVFRYEQPADYVPEPIKVETGEYAVGAQVCSMWTEGEHYGWDPINALEERRPYLGFYDENNPELSDWEIKWMLEHGISFEMYCWFRPWAAADDPIKEPALVNSALHKGFFNAKYSDKMKFMIMWEQMYYSAKDVKFDFENNIVPFWIEYYFKDPRYLTINGRPVLSFYQYNLLINQFGGTEGLKQAVHFLNTKCNEAGIKNPILISSGGQLYDRKTMKSMTELGFSGGCKYIRDTKIQDQKDALIYEKDEAIASDCGFEVIPTLTMGRNDLAWQNRAIGRANTPEEYEILLSWAKNELTPLMPDNGWDKKLAILATWNEFGEGHYIQPTNLYGFGYLDAVRSAFSGKTPHEDIVPTQAQKDRFNNLYPKDRTVPEQKYIKPIVKPEPKTYEVVKGFYFDKEGDTEGFGVSMDVGNLAVKNGALQGTVTGVDPAIVSLDNLGIDTQMVDFIRVRIKADIPPLVDSGQMYFTRNDSPQWGEDKVFGFKCRDTGDGYVESFIHMYLMSSWRGTLKQLRVDPVNSGVRLGVDTFSIDSIEFIKSNEELTIEGAKINFDTELKSLNPIPQVLNNKVMLPLRTLANVFKAKVDWDSETKTAGIVKDGMLTQLKIGEEIAYKGNDKIYLDVPATDFDGKMYVPIRFISEIFATDVNWSESEDTLYIKSRKQETLAPLKKKEKREIIYGVEFNNDGDFEGFVKGGDFGGAVVASGVFKADITGSDPYMHSKGNLNFEATDIKNISIGLQNETGGSGVQLFFLTDKSGNWDEEKTLNFNSVPNDTKMTEYNINTSSNAKWKDKITQFRFDPTSQAGSVKIDYIRFEGDVIKTEDSDDFVIPETDNQTHTTILDDEISWEFDDTGTSGGWNTNKHLGNVSVVNGKLNASVTGPMPELKSNGNLELDAQTIKSIKILYKNATQSNKARLYFITDQSPEWSEQQCFEINVNSNDCSSTRYIISTSDNSLWKGTLKGLKFAPTFAKGNISIDYIRMDKME